MDGEHRTLIENLNRLETAIQTGAGTSRIIEAVDALEAFAAAHFSREEACMHRLRCPTAAANRAAHGEFLAKVRQARTRIQSSGCSILVAGTFHRELCDWTSAHLTTVDSAVRSCLSRRSCA